MAKRRQLYMRIDFDNNPYRTNDYTIIAKITKTELRLSGSALKFLKTVVCSPPALLTVGF